MRTWAYCLLLPIFCGAKLCPEPTEGGSASRGSPCRVTMVNQLPEDLESHWVDFDGKEGEGLDLLSDTSEEHNSYEGHKFRFRSASGVLVQEYIVPKCQGGSVRVEVVPCEGLQPADDESWYDKKWDEMYSKLILPTQCDVSSPTSEWSCVRKLSKEDVDARVEGTYGFLPDETKGGRKPYQVKDDGYVEHIPQIPHMTPQAYLIMWQPDSIRQLLDDFYKAHSNTSDVKVHEPISGMYSNVHAVQMSKLDLDGHQHIRLKIVKEMQKVLQWWTHLRLRHTSTFGVRIYHENSMLINHVDRHDTHLASAVLQVAQEVEEGWPLELLGPSGTPIEAFLQPGQMVLYEGARVFHGRPMRFKGKSFANVFTHFAPAGYRGLGTGEQYDYRFRKGDAEVGWPRVRVGGKGDDAEVCSDSKGKNIPAPENKKESWWPF